MGKPVAQLGGLCSGHDCFPPRPNIEASPDVFAESITIQRIGDGYDQHCCPDKGCHDAVVAEGSGTVFANGQAVARIGDSLSCPSVVAEGASTVFAGD